MYQGPDSSDDEHHHDGKLVELECGIDLQVTNRHPAEQRLLERLRHLRTAHRCEDGCRKAECCHQHAWSDQTDEPGVLVPRRVRFIPGGVVADDRNVNVVRRSMIARIGWSESYRSRDRERTVEYEA